MCSLAPRSALLCLPTPHNPNCPGTRSVRQALQAFANVAVVSHHDSVQIVHHSSQAMTGRCSMQAKLAEAAQAKADFQHQNSGSTNSSSTPELTSVPVMGQWCSSPDGGAAQPWDLDPAEITICKRPDGSDWVLGVGSFGQVGPSAITAKLCNLQACAHVRTHSHSSVSAVCCCDHSARSVAQDMAVQISG